MPKNYVCPRCNGDGCKHRLDADSEADCVEECPECDSSGFVTRARRQELLAWAERCRGSTRRRPRKSGPEQQV